MNIKRRDAAIKKHSALDYPSKDALISGLESDDREYSKEEIEEIVVAMETNKGQSGSGGAPEKKQDQSPKEGPNADLDLSGFDYKNLVGDKFKEYVELAGDRSYREIDKETGNETPVVGKLKENDMHDFVLHKVDVVRKDRFPGMKDTPKDFIGVKIKTDKQELTTRISVKTAHELNAQILNAHSVAGHGKYYLLKK